MKSLLDQIKKLREITGAGVIDCQSALKEAEGDFDKAIKILKKKGQRIVEKKSGRETREGIIYAYVHHNKKIGALLELNCETDFVAKNEQFQNLAKEITLQIVATDPKYISPRDIPKEVIEEEKEKIRKELEEEKPPEVIEKIIPGKLEKFYSEVCLLKQPYIRDEKITVEDLIHQLIAKVGENIQIKRFCRFSL